VEALIPLALLFGIFWLLIIRPQRRQRQIQERLVSNLEPGQEILTTGGVYGTVREVQDEAIVLEIAPDTSVRVNKRAVAARIEPRIEEDAS
jgi:preprotein translocase subunit YajC